MTEISLREFLESILRERFETEHSRWRAHEAVHAQLDRAIHLAADDINRRLNEMNQFRAQINEERNLMVTKDTFFARVEREEKEIMQLILQLEDKIHAVEKWQQNMEGRLWMLGVVVTVISFLGNFVMKLLFK